MTLKVGKGRNEVTLSGALADGLEAELRAALGPVGERMQAEGDRILKAAREQWPVWSGTSRDSLATSLRVHPEGFAVEVVIFSPLEYVRYIKSTRVGDKKNEVRPRSPLQDLLRKPAREAEKLLATELPAIIAKAFGGPNG